MSSFCLGRNKLSACKTSNICRIILGTKENNQISKIVNPMFFSVCQQSEVTWLFIVAFTGTFHISKSKLSVSFSSSFNK